MRERWQRYVESAGRLLGSGGKLLLKQHAPEEGGRHGTHPPQPSELAELFARAFELTRVTPSTFDGTLAPPPRALLVELTRR